MNPKSKLFRLLLSESIKLVTTTKEPKKEILKEKTDVAKNTKDR